MIRMIFQDYMAKEEMKTILLLKGKQGKTFNRHLKVVSTKDITLNKLSLITTDIAPAMIGSRNRFITLCQNNESFPKIYLTSQCYKPEVLCSEFLPFQHVLDTVTKIFITEAQQ
jgi:hypothetical protein